LLIFFNQLVNLADHSQYAKKTTDSLIKIWGEGHTLTSEEEVQKGHTPTEGNNK